MRDHTTKGVRKRDDVTSCGQLRGPGGDLGDQAEGRGRHSITAFSSPGHRNHKEEHLLSREDAGT